MSFVWRPRAGDDYGSRSVCAAVEDVGQNGSVLSHQLLTAGDDAVFLATGLGAIAAVEADSGSLRWVVTYESGDRDSPTSDRERRENSPCLFAQNIVVAAPGDSNTLFAIDSRCGTTLWRRVLPGGVEHLLGTKDGVLIVSGQSLWGLDLATGHVVWHLGYTDPASFGFGRGILAGSVVYWPTREDIYVVDQATGSLRRRIPLLARYVESGGNLVLAGDFLAVAQSRRIVVFGPNAGPPLRKKQALPATLTEARRNGRLAGGQNRPVPDFATPVKSRVGRAEGGESPAAAVDCCQHLPAVTKDREMVDRHAPRVVAALSAVLLFAAGGCSPTTRLPSIFPGPGDTDSRSFNVHDPLPETDIGPDMGARPPGFMQDWSEPRRTRAAQGRFGRSARRKPRLARRLRWCPVVQFPVRFRAVRWSRRPTSRSVLARAARCIPTPSRNSGPLAQASRSRSAVNLPRAANSSADLGARAFRSCWARSASRRQPPRRIDRSIEAEAQKLMTPETQAAIDRGLAFLAAQTSSARRLVRLQRQRAAARGDHRTVRHGVFVLWQHARAG